MSYIMEILCRVEIWTLIKEQIKKDLITTWENEKLVQVLTVQVVYQSLLYNISGLSKFIVQY